MELEKCCRTCHYFNNGRCYCSDSPFNTGESLYNLMLYGQLLHALSNACTELGIEVTQKQLKGLEKAVAEYGKEEQENIVSLTDDFCCKYYE